MTFAAIESVVRVNVDAASADVDEAIDMSIKFLSNFFTLRKLDTSQTVSTGDTSVNKPDRSKEVLMVKIGNTYIKKLDPDKIQANEDQNAQRWYIEDEFVSDTENKIHLTEVISAADDGQAVVIHYLAGFAPLGGAGSTDLPEQLEPLLIMFATYFYYGLLVSFVKNNKSSFPNMTVWDVIAIWDTWRVHAFDLLEITQKQRI